MPYKDICFATVEVVRKAAAYIRDRHLNRRNLNIKAKGRQNFVTKVDTEAEQILVKGLSKVLPEAGFITEEGTNKKKGETYHWIIDPVDGTTNFIHGVFPFAISVGLLKQDEVVAGVIYEFGLDEYFYTWKGGGAWLNCDPIRVSAVPRVKDALIATGFPYTDFSYMEQFMESLDHFMRHSNGLRRLGSAATDIAYVACGRYDAFYEYGLNPWDIAAGILMVEEAGGRVSDFRGNADALHRGQIICSNGLIFDEFLDTVRKIMVHR
ncbi:MAG TPA: inositol monophosphatase [Bacteroides sp.]|nr:inositol monophosphatase [Bacteroides sp.]